MASYSEHSPVAPVGNAHTWPVQHTTVPTCTLFVRERPKKRPTSAADAVHDVASLDCETGARALPFDPRPMTLFVVVPPTSLPLLMLVIFHLHLLLISFLLPTQITPHTHTHHTHTLGSVEEQIVSLVSICIATFRLTANHQSHTHSIPQDQ